MRIGFDARVIHFPGIGRYTRNLLECLAALGTDDPFVVYISRDEHREALPSSLDERFTIRTLPNTFSVKEQIHVPRAATDDGLDLFHTTHYVVPLFLGCPCVATFHDLTYYKHPASLRSLPAQSYYRLMHRLGHHRVERIICNSDATGHDLHRILGVPREKLQTIYPGLDAHFGPVETNEVSALRDRLGCEEYLLYIGTKKRFKNVPALLRAFAALGGEFPRLHLVLGGRGEIEDPEVAQLLTEEALRGRVIVPAPLPDAEMPALYAGARALVLPSFNEGFGFPLAEAMICGTPCVVADAGSLPEVAGGAALLFPPHDVGALTRQLRRVLTEPELARELVEKGRHRARAFDAATAAAKTYAVYQDAGRSAGQHRGALRIGRRNLQQYPWDGVAGRTRREQR
jgi:glycosyltransferase involved in cell wall biosynthesis